MLVGDYIESYAYSLEKFSTLKVWRIGIMYKYVRKINQRFATQSTYTVQASGPVELGIVPERK